MQRWNPNQPPEDGLPPPEVRFTAMRAEPWPDNRQRVRVFMEITPFLERPNIEVQIMDSDGKEVSTINIIETIDSDMTFTMHIRGEDPKEPFRMIARLSYPELGTITQHDLTFTTNGPNG
jgi:hypothetical protein